MKKVVLVAILVLWVKQDILAKTFDEHQGDKTAYSS